MWKESWTRGIKNNKVKHEQNNEERPRKHHTPQGAWRPNFGAHGAMRGQRHQSQRLTRCEAEPGAPQFLRGATTASVQAISISFSVLDLDTLTLTYKYPLNSFFQGVGHYFEEVKTARSIASTGSQEFFFCSSLVCGLILSTISVIVSMTMSTLLYLEFDRIF